MLKDDLEKIVKEFDIINRPIEEKQYDSICWKLKDSARHGEKEYRHGKQILNGVVDKLVSEGLEVDDYSYFCDRFGGMIYKYIIKGW